MNSISLHNVPPGIKIYEYTYSNVMSCQKYKQMQHQNIELSIAYI